VVSPHPCFVEVEMPVEVRALNECDTSRQTDEPDAWIGRLFRVIDVSDHLQP